METRARLGGGEERRKFGQRYILQRAETCKKERAAGRRRRDLENRVVIEQYEGGGRATRSVLKAFQEGGLRGEPKVEG